VKRKACVSSAEQSAVVCVCGAAAADGPVAGYGRDFAPRSLAASSKSLRRL
jgi:hypothetical protein